MEFLDRKTLLNIGLIWGGCFILFLFVYMLVLSPQRTLRRQLASQLDEQMKACQSALEAADERTQAKFAAKIEELSAQLGAYAIEAGDSASLIFDIGQIAGRKNVDAFSITSQKSREAATVPDCKHIQESFISISFNGGFGQFATFLNELERHSPVVFVDEFSISRSDESNTSHRTTMKLAVFTTKQSG